jgi:radical SAM superfamily enzyme YgiQ (UPF0313 family)
VFGKTHRRRKPAFVANELEWLSNRYHPDMAWIADDVFTIHHGWLFQYAAELKQRRLKIPFECISRADRLNARVMDTLAEIGCFRIWIGSESGSQRVLDAMQRGVTVEQVQEAVALAKSRGIKAGMFLMWGYEGEGLEDVEATVEHVKQSDPDVFLTTVSYPIKGTPYFDEVSSKLVSLKPWAEGSDRDYQIRGRHSRQYYRYADQLLRSEVELSQLLHRPEGAAAGGAERFVKDSSSQSGRQAKPSSLMDLERSISEARRGLQASFAEVEA